MRIGIVSSWFAPDHTGIAVFSSDLAAWLSDAGHEVEVLTTFPHYPGWRKAPADRGVVYRRDRWRDIAVRRGYVWVPRRPTAFTRILYDLSALPVAFASAVRARPVDLVVHFTPSVILGAVALAWARRSRAPLVTHIQDLQVDAARNLAMLGGGAVIRGAEAIERWLLRSSARVVTLTRGMADIVADKGVASERIVVVPNWVDASDFASVPPGDVLARHGILERPVIAYAGNLGIKQNLGILLDVAARWRAEGRPGRFLLVGDGADRSRLAARVDEEGLANVTMLPTLSPQDYRTFLSEIDTFVVPQKPGAGEVFFPSKLLGLILSGCPVVVSAEGDTELGRAAYAAGLPLVAADDCEGLSEGLHEMGSRVSGPVLDAARQFAEGFDRAVILPRYVTLLEDLASRGREAA